MFEDYDVFYEPTEAEMIIEEAKCNIIALFTEEVKKTIEDAAKAKERLEKLQSQIRQAECKLRDANEQLRIMQERVDNAELYDVPRKYMSKFVQHATGGYAPGDVVYVVKDRGKWSKCKTCNGNKKVSAIICGNEEQVRCPVCDGRGETFVSEKVVEKTTVSNVYLKLCFSENRVCFWNTENVYLGRHDYSTDPKKIYRTEEEAIAALEGEKNA